MKCRRLRTFLLFVALPVQVMIIVGVHYTYRKDEKLFSGFDKHESGSLHGSRGGYLSAGKRHDEDASGRKLEKSTGKPSGKDGESLALQHHDRRLTHLGLEKKEGDHAEIRTASKRQPLLYQTPVALNQTKAAIEQLRLTRDRLFSDDVGPLSSSHCILPALQAPLGTCGRRVSWKCQLSPTFTSFDPVRRVISVNCDGIFRVNQIERSESEFLVSGDSFRQPPFWEYYEGSHNVTMETEYADIACKDKLFQDVHNYHTQFLEKPGVDWIQEHALRTVRQKEPKWKPVSILTVVLDSTSRAQFHRSCGLPKTAALLRKYYEGSLSSSSYAGFSKGLSHQSFVFNRLNGISSATVLNLTPMFSGELYEDVDEDKVRRGIYGKAINEWIWQYAEARGYLTSYGIDNTSGMMGTRTNCKACLYRPPALPHSEHDWRRKENQEIAPDVLSGLCDGNHMLHEHILNYTRDFLRHPHPAKWAALDLNAGHRKEMESVNQVDKELAETLKTLLQEDENLVIFLLGDHGKPFHKDPSNLGSYYETLLPFLSVTMPTWMLQQRPDVFRNLAINQDKYMVHADLHLSIKSLMHFPYMETVGGARGKKAVNIFTEEIPRERGCEDADMPMWSCVCGVMKKLKKEEWTKRHVEMAQAGISHINAKHSKVKLNSKTPFRLSSCIDLSFKRLLHVFVNENENKPKNSTSRWMYHMTFQTVEKDTIWDLVIDDNLDIKQVKQVSMYQMFDACRDKRVPLPFCVCDVTKRA
ncbi:uncharacterized protein [Diadema setosum]|uniref:uncharacterized protein n=1 Tax=Diadema setosum TaxID=31175 RepID=UPI003B3B0BF4